MCTGFVVLKVNFHWSNFHQHINKRTNTLLRVLWWARHIYIAYVIWIKWTEFALFIYIIYFGKNPKSTKREYFLILMMHFKFASADKENFFVTMKVIDYKWTWFFFFQLMCGLCTVLLDTRPEVPREIKHHQHLTYIVSDCKFWKTHKLLPRIFNVIFKALLLVNNFLKGKCVVLLLPHPLEINRVFKEKYLLFILFLIDPV